AFDGNGVQPFAVVVHDGPRGAPRHAIADLELETSQRKRRREQRMRLRERTFLADIEQSDLAALDQRLAHLRGRRRMQSRQHYQPARRLKNTEKATHPAAATVMKMPARARSLIEK